MGDTQLVSVHSAVIQMILQFLTYVDTVAPKTWTTPEQVTFLRLYETQYLKAAQTKKISPFFTDFFPQWFKKFLEEDASGDATDIEESSLSQKARKQLTKEKQATSAQRTIVEAQANLSV